MKNRMFVVPGPFVPYNDTITLLTYKRLRSLDLDIDVFALSSTFDQSIAEELKKDECFSKFHIKYTSALDYVIPRYHPLRLILSFFLMRKYIRDSKKEFENKKYKYLFTSIVPGVCHLAGKKIKEKHPEVIWYAAFSDPFKGSPYKNTELKNKNIFYRFAFHIGAWALYNNKYEEAAILNADKLVFICEEQRDFTISQYPNKQELLQKSIIMPLTYIPQWKMYQNLINIDIKTNKPLQAVHLGRLYGLRSISTFIDALMELKNEYPELNKQIVFHQYSEIQPEDVKKIKMYGLEENFIIHKKVSYKESTEIMKQSDILVLFDTLMPNQEIQPYLPSKIVEYLMLKKPILGICGNNSPSYRILKKYGFKSIGYTKEEIKFNIKSIINNKNKYEYSLDELNCDNYNMIKL